MKLPTMRVWACPAACLAMAIALAGTAAAQEEQDRSNQDQDQQEQSYDQSDRDSQRDDQDRQRQRQEQQRDQQQRQRDEQQRQRDQQDRQGDQQDRQRDQQSQQRDQQDRQRDQQSQQRDQQDRQRQQSQWDQGGTRQSQRESTGWPQPSRYEYGRQQQSQRQSDSYGQRQSDQTGRGQDAGLGVNIISEGGPGLLVTQIHPGSPAEEMGLRRNDRITHLNGQRVTSQQQFIDRIRNMNPGDEVELDVLRGRDEQTVRGELQTRQEALVLSNRGQFGQQRWQQGSDTWQTGYQEGYGSQQQGRTMRGGDFSSRLNSIEQQVNRMSRELEQIRYALQDLRQGGESGQISRFQRSGETQAGYDEYESGRYQDGRAQQWDGQSDRIRGEFRDERMRQDGTFRDTRQGQSFQGSGEFGRGSRSATEGGVDSSGGVTGGLRTRPQNDSDWSDRQ